MNEDIRRAARAAAAAELSRAVGKNPKPVNRALTVETTIGNPKSTYPKPKPAAEKPKAAPAAKPPVKRPKATELATRSAVTKGTQSQSNKGAKKSAKGERKQSATSARTTYLPHSSTSPLRKRYPIEYFAARVYIVSGGAPGSAR
jgi:hypothetical protein